MNKNNMKADWQILIFFCTRLYITHLIQIRHSYCFENQSNAYFKQQLEYFVCCEDVEKIELYYIAFDMVNLFISLTVSIAVYQNGYICLLDVD